MGLRRREVSIHGDGLATRIRASAIPVVTDRVDPIAHIFKMGSRLIIAMIGESGNRSPVPLRKERVGKCGFVSHQHMTNFITNGSRAWLTSKPADVVQCAVGLGRKISMTQARMRSTLPGQLTNIFHRRSACVTRGHSTFFAPSLWMTRYTVRSGQHLSTVENASTASLPEKTPGLFLKREEGILESSHCTENVCRRKRQQFDLNGCVYVVTGGASGIGLSMAEGLAEAGGEVYCLDRSDVPNAAFRKAVEQLRAGPGVGTLNYKCVDVTNTELLNEIIEGIATKAQRLDGSIAAAGINQVTPALDYGVEEARKLMDINFIGVLATATACARQMIKYKCRGSICLIASMSGLVANKGMLSPVYNSSKAGVIQLARNLAMEWGKVQDDGASVIRVNALSPGHVLTPMVQKTFEEVPDAKEKWEGENLMGRLGDPSEFKGAALFLLSEASSFMTGNNLVIDGGHTAW